MPKKAERERIAAEAKAKQEEIAKADSLAKFNVAEAKRKADEDKIKKDAEAKAAMEAERKRIEEEKKAKIEADAIAKVTADSLKAFNIAETKRLAEEARLKKAADEKARVQAIEDAKAKAIADAKAKAEEEERLKAEEAAKIQAAQEAAELARIEKEEAARAESLRIFNEKKAAQAKIDAEKNKNVDPKILAERAAKAKADSLALIENEINSINDKENKNKALTAAEVKRMLELQTLRDAMTSASALKKEYAEGITEEKIEETKLTTYKTIVKRKSSQEVYKKVVYNWGGVFYFKNDQSISELSYNLLINNAKKELKK
ncbi:MAG: hypothetical protein IPP29_14055 [Bacteroidetes bacterium]|nr:hypothetical protein [Bacteroidota bacterium]